MCVQRQIAASESARPVRFRAEHQSFASCAVSCFALRTFAHAGDAPLLPLLSPAPSSSSTSTSRGCTSGIVPSGRERRFATGGGAFLLGTGGSGAFLRPALPSPAPFPKYAAISRYRALRVRPSAAPMLAGGALVVVVSPISGGGRSARYSARSRRRRTRRRHHQASAPRPRHAKSATTMPIAMERPGGEEDADEVEEDLVGVGRAEVDDVGDDEAVSVAEEVDVGSAAVGVESASDSVYLHTQQVVSDKRSGPRPLKDKRTAAGRRPRCPRPRRRR